MTAPAALRVAVSPMDTPFGREGSKGSEGSGGSEGKVDGADSPEGCGRLPAAGCVRFAQGGSSPSGAVNPENLRGEAPPILRAFLSLLKKR